MKMTVGELGEKVAAKYEQAFAGTVEGPNRFGPYYACRVWTYDGDEYHAHYAVEHNGKLKMFEDFAPFANWLADEFSLETTIGNTERKVRIAVASCVVLVALGLLVYLTVWQPEQATVIKYLLAAIVGAAASYVFLKKPPKTPG